MPSRRATARTMTAFAALVACAPSGCGGSTQSVGRSRMLHLALTEYRIDPQKVRARVGKLTIVVHNYGRRTHDLVVTAHGQNVGKTAPIWPGNTSRLVLTLPAGNYTIASTILSDRTLGEYGTLTVR